MAIRIKEIATVAKQFISRGMAIELAKLPDDIDVLKAELAQARAKASDDQALIAHQKLLIEKLRRELYDQSFDTCSNARSGLVVPA